MHYLFNVLFPLIDNIENHLRIIHILLSFHHLLYPFTSYFSMRKDTPVLEVKLDVDDMAKSHKA